MRLFIFSIILTSSLFITYSQSIPITGDQYHYYGPNSSWGEYLKIGGNGRGTTKASVVTTNGNLHIDSKNGNAIYLNHYSQSKTLLNTLGGNVGIGTTSPDYKLDINGSVRLGIDNTSGLLISRFTSGLNDIPGSTGGIVFNGPIHSHIVYDILGNDLNDGFYIRVPSILQNNPTVDKTAFVVKSNSNIGIGTSTVDDNLHLKKDGGNAIFKIENTGNGNASVIKFSRERQAGEDVTGGAIGLVSNTSTNWSQLFLNSRSGSAEVGVNGSGNQTPFLTIGSGYNNNVAVGINSTSPDYPLDVNGSARLGIDNDSGVLISRFTSGLNDVPGSTGGIQFQGPIHSHLVFDIKGNDQNDGFYVRVPSNLQINPTVDKTAFVVKSNGNVGIGTTSTGTHKLAVEGTIGAREIKVEASGWSDFVFEKDYKLPTLEEVEKHINDKGHLPEIPSEAEVTENGINLGEMNAKLLQKIEELTLYLIEQNKEIKALKEEVSELKAE
ncbi:MAG: hypothetical protein AAF391_01270 [Bacteroidota bacterium]